MQIAMKLGTPPLSEDPSCHSVPILDLFGDDTDPNFSFLVMPFLRNFYNPPFECVEDVLDFGEQLLEVSTKFTTDNSQLTRPD